MNKIITIVFDSDCVDRYNAEYFINHPHAKNPRIKSPKHPSLNEYMSTNPRGLNRIKADWCDFVCWRLRELKLDGLNIDKCRIVYRTYFANNRRHDADNITPKFIFDGFRTAGFLVDDDLNHVVSLTIEGQVDKENPRMEFEIEILRGDDE